jgi:major membrane immunogen (membrane-anchored lipoprotein)
MKRKIFLCVLLLTGYLFSSCDSEDFKYEDDFNKSHKVWLNFKSQSNNSYKYTVKGGTWVGASWETTITVKGGKIVERHFEYTHIAEELTPVEDKEMEWTEGEDEINTHKETHAWIAMTLDDIYAKAKEDWLKERKDANILFETKNDGMISLCGYTPGNCADDCFRGISIKQIEALE